MKFTLKELEQKQDKDISCIDDLYDAFGYKFLTEVKEETVGDITLILDDEYQIMAWSMEEEGKVVLDMYKGDYNDGGYLYFMSDECLESNEGIEGMLLDLLRRHF
jgi:hypothetical protein